MSTNRVDSRNFSSQCCAFRRTHTSAEPIWLICIRLALPSTLPLPSRFAPSARLMAGGTPCALWFLGDASSDYMLWEKRGGRLTGQLVGPPVGTAAMTIAMSANRVDLGSVVFRYCTFRRTHTSADPIRLLCIRLALRLTLSLPSRLAPSARLTVSVPPGALWMAGFLLRRKKRCAGVIGTRTD